MTVASWFDGRSAAGRRVEARPAGEAIELVEDGVVVERVAVARLVRAHAPAGETRLAHRDIDGWRLLIDGPVDAALAEALPSGGWFDPAVVRWPMALAIGATALVTLALGLLVFAPETAARHMPMAWEQRLGSLYDLPIEAGRCDDARAAAALDALVDRLDPTARADGLRITLLDVEVANAAALPGRRMLVFTGLFDEVDNADALAGIVAHEIAHVRRRHVAAGMVRELGIGTAVALAGGGALAGSGGDLLSLGFSREAEAEADGDAIAMLNRANIDPAPTKRAFDQFDRMEVDLPTWINSHPASKARGERFAAARDPRRAYRPALGVEQQRALLSACDSRPGPAAPAAAR